MKKFYLTAFLALLVSGMARSTTWKELSIGESFALADARNADIVVARNAVDVAGQQVKVARTGHLPQIDVSLSLSYLGDGTILDRDFGNARRDELPHFSNTLNVELYQPLFAGGAITGAVDLARKQEELAGIGLDAARNSIRMEVVRNYLDLSKYRNLLKVYEENIELTRKLLEEMRTRHACGVVLKNDITRYELKLSSLDYDRLEIENAIRVCNHNLVSLLGLDPDTEIRTTVDSEHADSADSGADTWLQSAYTHSDELKSVGAEYDLSTISRRIARAEYFPKIGLVIADNLLGPVTFEVPALNKNYNAWFVGVNLRWNISSLFTTGRSVRKIKMEMEHNALRRQAVEQKLGRRITEAYTLYRQSQERLGIERKNVQLADENYDVVSNRFDKQLALLTDMLDASNARLDAGVRLVNAEISTLFYYYQLHFITGTLAEL